MSLSAGDQLGPYQIVASIGEGGMGQVYKARDPRLNRDVAIKLSAAEFSDRFAREAQLVASLNHPNICTLHDVGPNYLVMELIEGPTLADRIAQSAIPIDETLAIARQLADALEAAHDKGIVHRDLKPANIKIAPSGQVKVLDFGLAKALEDEPGVISADAATIRHSPTRAGIIMGTPAYMSPEPARGKPVDRRSDIWAFGVLCYEMLTAKPLHSGETVTEILASVITSNPDLAALPANIPAPFRRLLGRCLKKDPRVRLSHIAEARIVIDELAAGAIEELATGAVADEPTAPTRQGKAGGRWIWRALAALSTITAASLGFLYLRQSPPPVYTVRFEQPAPQAPTGTFSFGHTPTVSPDGRSFAYAGILEGNTTALWIRRLNELNATRLPDTEDASLPFWSPDSRSLAFFAGGKLKKIDPSGGPAQTICDAGFFLGGTWSREGVILLGGSNRPISRVTPAGDAVQPLLKLDAAHKETSQGWPHFLPDGRHFVYTSTSVESGKVGIYVASLDSSQPRLLIENAASATYVFPGLLVFGRGRSLMAQAFDAAKLELSGEPFPVVDQVDNTRSSFAYSASSNGVLVYQHNQSAVTGSQPVWYNREGKRLSAAGEPRLYTQGSLSPDEKRFAAQIRDPNTRINDLWTLELASGILSRITSGTASKNTVYWSPDGREVLFSSSKSGVMNLFRKPAGGGDDRLVQASARSIYPLGWLSDGSITFRSDNSFLRLSPSPGAKPETLFKSDHSIDELRVSPDGRWATYNSNETGRSEVYIVAFPLFTERRQVSNNGGAQGYWRKDGKELFYLSLNGNLVSVPLKPGPTLEPGIPKILFPTRLTVEPLYDQFAATGDGQRFLVIEPVETAATPFTIVLNWPAGLKK